MTRARLQKICRIALTKADADSLHTIHGCIKSQRMLRRAAQLGVQTTRKRQGN
jgi:hypothetical protein